MQLPQKVGVSGMIIVLLGILIGWAIFPPMLRGQIAQMKGLAPGSESRQLWEKLPFPVDFRIYVFNVTNYGAVQENGDKPMLDEIGPYCFKQWKEKAEVIDYASDDSVSFHVKNTFVFDAESSAPLTGNEIVAVPHPLLMGILGSTERKKPSVLGMVSAAVPKLFNRPSSIFSIGTAFQLLFEGSHVDCTSKEFAVVAVCTLLKKEVQDLVPTNVTNLFKYSLFGAKNGTADANKFRVNRGILKSEKVGEMMYLNDKRKLPNWRGSPCNDLVGTDSTVFAPDVKEKSPMWSFSLEMCRSLPGKFVGKTNYKGVEAFRFTIDMGDMSAEPSLKCFCPANSPCLKKGVFDLLPCTGAPVLISKPHFYDSDEEYLKGVRGLHPDGKKHEIRIDFEPYTGTPLDVKKRVMFSMPIHRIKNQPLTDNLPSTVLPFMWVEESLELGDDFVGKLDRELFRFIRVADVVKWFLVLGGVALSVTGVALYYKRKNSLAVTPVPSTSATGTPARTADS